MSRDLDAVLSQYRDSLNPLIEVIKAKRAQLTSNQNLLNTHPSSYTMAGPSRSHKGRSPRPTPYAKQHKLSHSPSPGSDAPLISLQAYLSNIFYGVLIQDDDDISEVIYNGNWSRRVKERYTSLPRGLRSQLMNISGRMATPLISGHSTPSSSKLAKQ